MASTDCPSKADLTAFHLGELPANAVDAVATHIESCPRCDQILRQLDRVADAVIASLRKLPGISAAFPDDVAIPRRIGDYEILGELGRGGMGVVYKARHVQLHRLVALKMLVSGEFAQEDFRARFRAEAATVARLQHPNIVHIIDLGEWQGNPGSPPVPYFTLEYVDGGSLANLLAGKPQPPQQAADWLLILAQAVHYAHGQGIIHRDLKPANVLVTAGGLLKLCDFGVAKRLTGADLKTRSGLLVGTPEYMAPEQAQGQPAGPAADVYALGAMLYTMLTGRPPFQGTTPLDTLEQVRSQEPVPPRRLQPAIPRDLELICLKCLAKEPPHRYAGARALADDLERFRNGRTIQARPAGVVARGWKWSRRRPALAALLALSLLVLGIGFPGVTYLWRSAAWDREQATRERDEKANALYASTMRLAAGYLFQGNDLVAADRLLMPYAAGEPARLRGWEWYYLHRLGSSPGCLLHRMTHNAPAPSTWVHALAFSPDGRHVASAAGLPPYWAPPNPPGACHNVPGEVKVWDAVTGACLHTFADHRGAVWSIAYSPDGRQIAAGGADGRLHLWDATTYHELSGYPLDRLGEVWDLKYVPGRRLLAVSAGDRLGLWDVAARAWKWLTDHTGPGQSALAPSWDGLRLVASNVASGTAKAWDIRTSHQVSLPLPGGQIRAMAWSRDDQLLALVIQNGHTLHAEVWDTAGHRLLNPLGSSSSNVLSVAFGPDHLLAVGGQDHTVRLWRIHPGGAAEELRVFRGHQGGVTCLAFNGDGTRLASGGEDHQVLIWDTRPDPRGLDLYFQDVPNGYLGEWLEGLAFAADGQRLRLVGQAPGGFHLRTWDLATGVRLSDDRLELPAIPDKPHRDLAFSGDGGRLAGLDRKDPQAIHVWDAQTGRPITTVTMSRTDARVLALSHDGQRLAVAGWPDHSGDGAAPAAELTIMDATSGQERCRMPALPALPANLAFSRDGRQLAAVFPRGAAGSVPPAEVMVLIFDPATGRELRRFEEENQVDRRELVFVQDDRQPLALAFSPDGRRLALAGPANLLRIWEMTSGRECPFSPLKTLSGLTGVVFSPDGRRLAATGYDGRVQLWDADAGHELLTLRGVATPGSGHYTFTARVAFSPDGRYLAANDWDGTVFVWDAGPHP